MTEDTHPDRPLVTFALFAYNQEQYIRKAVEGAFSQTYEPLEIILSDDCSSDRTFEIMQEMAAAYEGPHEVRVRQSLSNVGTLSHLLSVAREAVGSTLVVAAGDDISMPERTGILSMHFLADDIAAVSSDDVVIDSEGCVRNWQEERINFRNLAHRQNPAWVQGASAAYRSDFLRALPLPEFKVLHEDAALQNIFLMSKRRSVRIKDKLIFRRAHLNNVSFKLDNEPSIDKVESENMVRWKRISEVYFYCAEVALLKESDNMIFSQRFFQAGKYFKFLAQWPVLKASERIELLLLSKGQAGFWTCLPRLFGRFVFKALKGIKNTQLFS